MLLFFFFVPVCVCVCVRRSRFNQKLKATVKKKKRKQRKKKKRKSAKQETNEKDGVRYIYIYTGGYLSIFAPTKRAITQEEYKNQENASHKREKRKLKVVLNSIIELLKERKKKLEKNTKSFFFSTARPPVTKR